MRVSIPMALAAAGVLLVGAVAVLPGWYRQGWIWESPVQATMGASLAVIASAVSLALAVGAQRQRVKYRTAVAAGSALLVVVILGGLLFVRSGANVIPVFISP
jgi:hypothetical protein